MQNEKSNNGFGTGFLLGLLFGVCLTLLLVTKKGRKLFRTFTEEGFENVKDLRQRLREADVAIDEDLYYDDLEEASVPPAKASDKGASVSAAPVQKPVTNGVKKSRKKLFRGIPKKSSS